MTAEVVIPSAGRSTLPALVEALRGLDVILVDDRRDGAAPLLDPVPSHVRVVRGPARGPAAARNAGWRRSRADWVAFLDDDVEPEAGWADALRRDLAGAGPDVGGVQGRIVVPLPAGRRPTDWERSTRGLETARWATADLAYRRDVLDAVGGFDERFPRAYREDADLGLRVTAAGRRIVVGERVVRHPVRPAPPWVSLAKQAGNADDVLMRRLHGRGLARARRCPARAPPAPPRHGRCRRARRGARGRRPPPGRRRRRHRLARRHRRAGRGAHRPRPAHAPRGRDDAVDQRADALRGDRLVPPRPRHRRPRSVPPRSR